MTDGYTINQKSMSICTINREFSLRDTRLRSIRCIPLKKGLEDRFWDDGEEVPIPFIISPEINRVLWDKCVDSIYFACSDSDSC